jgi:hypothetical protein
VGFTAGSREVPRRKQRPVTRDIHNNNNNNNNMIERGKEIKVRKG